ncbi:hypothetical protein PG995_011497 [Apiospora arundinis]
MTVIERPHTPLVGIDEESVALILELQRQDGELLGSVSKGKQREGSMPSDAEIALKLYLEELSVATVSLLDHRIAKSIQTAVREDADTLKMLLAEEHMATQDHRLSLQLSGTAALGTQIIPVAPVAEPHSAEEEDMELIEKMSCIYVTGEHDDPSDCPDTPDDQTSVAGQEPEGSAWAASRPHRARICISCGERRHFTDVSRAPCQHEYCRECLKRLFEESIRDETLFPPRCCKRPPPLDKNILFLPQAVVKTFREKAVEFSTPNRTYCHRKDCLAFIPPDRYVNGVAHCGDCAAKTCISCKGASHSGDCPHDEGLQQVIELARSVGWQRCKKCWAMVELRTDAGVVRNSAIVVAHHGNSTTMGGGQSSVVAHNGTNIDSWSVPKKSTPEITPDGSFQDLRLMKTQLPLPTPNGLIGLWRIFERITNVTIYAGGGGQDREIARSVVTRCRSLSTSAASVILWPAVDADTIGCRHSLSRPF